MYHDVHIKGMIVMIRDIEVRKLAEDEVLLSEQRFKGLVQSGADMISIIDEEGFVKYSSSTVTTVLGNNPTTDIGKNVFQFIHPKDIEWTRAAFDSMLRDGTRQMHFGPYRFPNAKRISLVRNCCYQFIR
jgi:PAS domain S-box-containing protein